MNDKELSDIIDLLYSYILKKLKEDGAFKNCVRSVNAKVTWVDPSTETVDGTTRRVSNINRAVRIKLPYDNEDIAVINRSTSELSVGNLVCVHYCIDLKNAYVAYKV